MIALAIIGWLVGAVLVWGFLAGLAPKNEMEKITTTAAVILVLLGWPLILIAGIGIVAGAWASK